MTLLQGSYLEPLLAAGLGDRIGVLVSNPPYVRPGEMSMLDPEVHAEPPLAIASVTADGMESYRIMAAQAAELTRLRMIAFEVGFAQADDVAAMFTHLGEIEILSDFNGIERMVIVYVR